MNPYRVAPGPQHDWRPAYPVALGLAPLDICRNHCGVDHTLGRFFVSSNYLGPGKDSGRWSDVDPGCVSPTWVRRAGR